MIRLCLVFVYIVIVNGGGVFHEHSKITLYPDINFGSDYFGYSVLFHRNGLIVGAPKAMNRERTSVSSGLIFNCSLTALDQHNVTCKPVPISEKDRYNRAFYQRMRTTENFFRNDMWFGATVGAISDTKLLTCAPRYTEPYGTKHILALGACYMRQSKRDYIVNPMNDKIRLAYKASGYRKEYSEYGDHLNYYAYAQAGMSMKVADANHVIIGAPGVLQWSGSIINMLIDPSGTSNYYRILPISNPYVTPELGPDDYFGYSVESGVFQPNGSMLYVGGAPRSHLGHGQVLVFVPSTREMDPLLIRANLRGPQLGSYFGASLCCLDIDGDGAADLLVGAPNYVVKDGGLPFDQGAVFVYMTRHTNSSFRLESSGYVSGSGESGARFGTTIADLGDIDGDGFKDVAIAAPWENEGSGVVYVYRGYTHGLRTNYNQRILAEGSGGFGLSIARGVDVDGNNCNDIAIGAVNSATAYVYRSIPTVLVRSSIKVPDAMNLPHNATGFAALFCVTLPKKPFWPHVKCSFKAKITIDPEGNRASVTEDSEYTVVMTPGEEKCDEKNVEVKPTADLSKPISMKFELVPEDPSNSVTFDNTAARVSEDSELESSFLIQLVRDCGEDLVCSPWLVMTLEALDKHYVPGTDSKLGARLTILNKEEPAYGAKVNISLPEIPKRLPSACSLEDLMMICDVPAPLLRNEEVVWEIELEYHYSNSSELNLKVVAQLEDQLYYRNISKDSVLELYLDVFPEASFNISGKTLPNDTITISREKLDDKENITFTNFIEIRNLGPSDWYHVEVHFMFDIVYLSGPVENCEDEESQVVCFWSIPAKTTLPVAIPLRLDLSKYGEILEKEIVVNTSSQIFVLWGDIDGEEFSQNITISTSFVLEPKPPLWPLILCIVAGVILGLLLLGLIIYLLHKYGFFSRRHHQRLKELQEQGHSDTGSSRELETSASPSAVTANASDCNESTRELLFEDSD